MKAHEILGVPENVGQEDIRSAYLSKVKEFPPDRAAAEFEKIRDAYDHLRDPRKRAQAMLQTREFAAPLTALLEGRGPSRVFTGPQAWRDVLRKKS